jgi:hypothetical protein
MTDFPDRPDEDLVFWDPETDRQSRRGGIGFYDPGYYNQYGAEPPSFELVIDLKNIGAVMRFMKKSFPKGWDIKNGEIVGL